MNRERCYCECHALENFGWDQKTKKCKHCNQSPIEPYKSSHKEQQGNAVIVHDVKARRLGEYLQEDQSPITECKCVTKNCSMDDGFWCVTHNQHHEDCFCDTKDAPQQSQSWEEKVRQDYKDILSEEQIDATINYWKTIQRTALAKQRSEIAERIKELPNKILADQANNIMYTKAIADALKIVEAQVE